MSTTEKTSIEMYDVTPRDGDQTDGISLGLQEKLGIAGVDDAIQIDWVEAGFPSASGVDAEVIHHLMNKQQLTHTKVAAFGMTRRKDLPTDKDKALRTLVDSRAQMLTIVGKASTLQVREALRVKPKFNLAMISDTFHFLKNESDAELTFDAEHFFDGYKHDSFYALSALRQAANNGATRLVLCDTNGGQMPEDIAKVVEAVRKKFEGLTIGIHAHNDRELAVANTLAAVHAGATHVQGSWNGMGERTGNANLSSVIANLGLDQREYKIPQLDKLTDASKKISQITRLQPNARMPFVGSSAFAHKGGMHIAAVQRNAYNYEHARPETFGNKRRFLLSKQSGKSVIPLIIDTLPLMPDNLRQAVRSRPDLQQKILDAIEQEEARGLRFQDAEASLALLVLRTLDVFEPKITCVNKPWVHDQIGGTTTAVTKIKINGFNDFRHTVSDSDGGALSALDMALNKALVDHFPQVQTFTLTDYRVDLPSASHGGTASPVHTWMQYTNGSENWETTGADHDSTKAGFDALKDAIEFGLLISDESAQKRLNRAIEDKLRSS